MPFEKGNTYGYQRSQPEIRIAKAEGKDIIMSVGLELLKNKKAELLAEYAGGTAFQETIIMALETKNLKYLQWLMEMAFGKPGQQVQINSNHPIYTVQGLVDAEESDPFKGKK